MFWPSHLIPIYPFPHALPKWEVASAAVLLLAVTLAVLKYRESRYLFVGWFWFLGTMVPMIGLVQVGNQAMADRYAYLPFIGLFVMLVWGAGELADACHIEGKYLAVVGLAVLCGFSAVTRIQIGYWKNGFSLWTHAMAISPHNFVAENNLAVVLLNLGIDAQEQGDFKQAAVRYESVLELTTDAQLRASAYSNLGSVCFALHDYTRARQSYESAMKLNVAAPVVLRDMGLLTLKSGDWNQASYYFARWLAVQPSDVGYLLLSHALEQGKRDREANLSYQHAQRLTTDFNQAQQRATQLMAQ